MRQVRMDFSTEQDIVVTTKVVTVCDKADVNVSIKAVGVVTKVDKKYATKTASVTRLT